MVGVCRSDAVITKLNKPGNLTVFFCFHKDKPDALAALPVGQYLGLYLSSGVFQLRK